MAFVVNPFAARFQIRGSKCMSQPRKSTRSRFFCVRPKDVDSASLLETIDTPVRVALTRERGKNEPFYEALRLIYPMIEIVRMPCVKTVLKEGSKMLPSIIRDSKFAWIVITSPEAASIFISAWRTASCPPLGKIGAVGKATGDCLRAVGIDVAFEPTKATGKVFVKQIPPPTREGELVLYPASLKASNAIVDGLTSRGYEVNRLNTYSTEPVVLSEKYKIIGKGTHIVTFASPSAIKSWAANVGVVESVAAACIGETSANAARDAGFTNVICPEKPGLEGWITAVCEAIKRYDGGVIKAELSPSDLFTFPGEIDGRTKT